MGLGLRPYTPPPLTVSHCTAVRATPSTPLGRRIPRSDGPHPRGVASIALSPHTTHSPKNTPQRPPPFSHPPQPIHPPYFFFPFLPTSSPPPPSSRSHARTGERGRTRPRLASPPPSLAADRRSGRRDDPRREQPARSPYGFISIYFFSFLPCLVVVVSS